MSKEKTREPQYQRCIELRDNIGLNSLGLGVNQLWEDDPRHLVFLLSRYKFVSKMYSGMDKVLEIGCGDAFGTRLLLQEVNNVVAIDFDPVFINDIEDRKREDWKLTTLVHDILTGPVEGEFDGAFSLDVLEHIQHENEDTFVNNVCRSIHENGVLIIGTPSLESQEHASALSKAGHINCKDHNELRILMKKFFYNVFILSMNDEVVHTGFYPMAHYLFAVCCNKK